MPRSEVVQTIFVLRKLCMSLSCPTNEKFPVNFLFFLHFLKKREILVLAREVFCCLLLFFQLIQKRWCK